MDARTAPTSVTRILEWRWFNVSIAFWLSCFALYLFDPYDIYPPADSLIKVLIFLALTIFCFGVGAAFGRGQFTPLISSSRTAKRLFLASLLLNFIILPLNVSTYAGVSLLEVPGLIFDPASAYSQMHDSLAADRSERIELLAFKAIFSWLLVLFLPLAIILYRERRIGLISCGLAFGCAVVFSIARGTDKELFDIAILVFASLLLPIDRPQGDRSKAGRVAIWPYIVGGAGLVFILAAFVFRKTERLAQLTFHCFQNTNSCIYLNDYIEDPFTFLFIMGYRYLTHGFNGLEAAVEGAMSFCPFYGHSRPLTYLAEQFGMNCDAGIVQQLDYLGWTSRGAWSTGFVQLGNDFGLWLVPVFFLAFGWYTRRLYRSVSQTGCYIAKTLFVYNIYTLLYMVGNLQLAQTGDIYFGYLFWTAVLFGSSLFIQRRA
ncbi:hypothetical protein B5C34_04955 [Pacificimonas flava]|uniref:Oligosaccharide repeat unit polymerase n=2 Tax=Pacificimonas TaxID=1960290 RepID=A0A219B3V7_9SPHN|nr:MULTISPECIES: hypothetical protein [Pacificimonas]MBZ6377434.1 hypothetical protein [Pacificimonas aurantium]OWV32864.1 hypothetical protein B5C34_04955 [Pacificimonas flava]